MNYSFSSYTCGSEVFDLQLLLFNVIKSLLGTDKFQVFPIFLNFPSFFLIPKIQQKKEEKIGCGQGRWGGEGVKIVLYKL